LTVEAPRKVTCSRCGGQYQLSARNARQHRRLGLPDLCEPCRHPVKAPDPKRVEAMKAWWLSRFTLEELRAWPPL
jgi:hypothetical protein